MKLLSAIHRPTPMARFIHYETPTPLEVAPEATPQQIHARGEILEILLTEINVARPGYFERDNFIETDDAVTHGLYIQTEVSDFRSEALAIDPNAPAGTRPNIKVPGEIILDQANGVGEYVDDVKILGQLDPALLANAGFEDKSGLVTWLRLELSYATEVANTRLEIAEEKRHITPGVSLRNILTQGPAKEFAAEQMTVLTAQANIMTLPGDLDDLSSNLASTEETARKIDVIEQKLKQVSEAGFNVSALRARLQRLKSAR